MSIITQLIAASVVENAIIANRFANKPPEIAMVFYSLFSFFNKLFSKQTEINNLFSQRDRVRILNFIRDILTNARLIIYVGKNYA